MSAERDLFERAINEAYEREFGDGTTAALRKRIVSRGRRRRAVRALSATLLVAVALYGASTTVAVFRDGEQRLAGEDVPVIGSEKIMDFGGPFAATNEELFVANGFTSNDAGDKESIARYDLDTGEVSDTDPTSMSTPHNVSLGAEGLWMVTWSGDLGDDASGARGGIQLVDPSSGEVLLDIPRDESAPSDVVAGEKDGRPVAWVVDAGTNQLLEVDAATGAIDAIDVAGRPNNVIFDAGFVWVTSNHRDGATLTRYDPVSGAIEAFTADDCMNDLVVVDGSVWVIDFCGEAVRRFDSETGEHLATVQLKGHASAITVVDGLLWIMRDNDVVRVDPESDRMVGDPIVLPGESFDAHIAAVGEDVFVSTVSGVFRLAEGLPVRKARPERTPTPEETTDPLSSETCGLDHVMCIPLDREWSVAGAGFGSAWVGNIGEGDTFGTARFDAETGEEIARLHTDGFVQAFASDERWMWVLLESGDQLTLLQVDPGSTTIENSFDFGPTGNIGISSLTTGGGYVWVSQPNGDVARLSVDDGQIAQTPYGSDLPGYNVSNGPLHLAFADDHLWLSYGKGHLGAVDPSSGELMQVDKDALGVNAYQIVAAGDTLWSPHQDVDGTNVVSYASTSGDAADRGRVVFEQDAPPGLAAADQDRVWVVLNGFGEKDDSWLVQIDASSREQVGEPLEIGMAFQAGVAAADGFAWVTGDRVLYRVTPQS